VDDLMATSQSQDDLDTFGLFLKSVYQETRTTSGSRLDYIGMTFDCRKFREYAVDEKNDR
jgi:hypothetical protein